LTSNIFLARGDGMEIFVVVSVVVGMFVFGSLIASFYDYGVKLIKRFTGLMVEKNKP
jgi:hypothetical protein